MCAVSMVVRDWAEKFPLDQWQGVPQWPPQAPIPLDDTFKKYADYLKKAAQFQEEVDAAKRADEAAGTPDCEGDSRKDEYIRALEERVKALEEWMAKVKG